ncbi:ATP-dependent 6-phosphofructokinase 2, partial [Zea mays]
MRGLVRIFEGVQRLGVPVAAAGVPKTVDNNVGIIDRSFGFHTAVEAAQRAIAAAHVEPRARRNRVGLVKLRHAGEMLTVKYIDPSYMVRAVAADNLCCTLLAHSAIDGAMAGYTGFVPGLINGNYGYIPVVEVAEARNPVDTSGLGS